MIYEKSLSLPKYYVRRIKKRVSLFQEEQNALYASGVHLREKDGEIVMAEGAEFDSALPADCLGLVLSSGYESQSFYRLIGGGLRRISDGARFSTHNPHTVLIYRAQDGEEKMVAISDREVYFHDGKTEGAIEGMEGGTSGCIAYERLFIAKGERIRWSNPLEPDNFSESLSGAGYADLPSFEGDILEMIPYKDKIFLIRDRGITVLCVEGEPLSYRAEGVPCAFGKIIAKTMRLCGERVIFLTESGLCAFDGRHIERLFQCGFEEIDLKESNFNAASVHGNYYAAVRMKGEEKERIWVVDPVKKRGHFICVDTRMIMGGDELYFAKGEKIYRLTECGLPYSGESARLTCERTLLNLSPREKFLDGVSFDREGSLILEAVSERGEIRRAFGRAGERMRFKTPLRGVSFQINVETVCESVKIRNITFEVREARE